MDYYIECDDSLAAAFREYTGQMNSLVCWAGPDMWFGNQFTPDEAEWLRQHGARVVQETNESPFSAA